MELTNRQIFGLQQLLQQESTVAPSPFTDLEPVAFRSRSVLRSPFL